METVYVLVKTEPGLLESVMSDIKEKTQVAEVSAVTGAYDIIVKVSGDYITDALGIVVRDIRKIRGVISTETLIAVRM
ncbi:MAG: Lrp/AsnC family transcriptional regulator [Euryarchaeota archaeon]|nr:Lrp/AsnC family transcriptional regulator [Euryarchaeota archaeon]